MNKIFLLSISSLAFILSSCESVIIKCDVCDNVGSGCACQCCESCEREEKTVIIDVNNYQTNLRIKNYYIGSDGSFSYFKLEINGIFDFVVYDGLVKFKTNDSVDHDNNEIFLLNLDKGGFAMSCIFKFELINEFENVNPFSIIDVCAKYSYFI